MPVAESVPFDPSGNVLLAEECQSGIEEAATLVSVSSNDTTPDHLINKIIGVSGVTLTEVNDGGNEKLELQADLDIVDINVKVSDNDTDTGYLTEKLVAGSGITITELNDGGDEDLEISADLSSVVDKLVKVSSNDTTAEYLSDQLVAGSGIVITEQNDGGNEDLKIDVIASGAFFDNSTNGFESTDIQGAIEEVTQLVRYTRMVITAGYSGVASAKWLEFFRDISSDEIPFVLAGDATLKDISLAHKEWQGSGTANIEIKKNGVTVYTFQISSPDMTKYVNDIDIEFLAGDKISVYAVDSAADTRTPVMYLFFLVEESV